MQRPNILLFIMDGVQGHLMRPDHPGYTPHFDRLAARGLRVNNAYTPSPTCSPARASLMTGLLPHNHGVLQVEHVVDPDQCLLRTDRAHWAQHLERAGYATGYFGKWHIERTDALEQFGWQTHRVLGRSAHRTHSKRGGGADVPLDPQLTRYLEGPDGYNPILHYGVTDVEPSERGMGQTAREALRFLQQQEGSQEPWCCCASYYEPNEAMIVSRTAFERIDRASIQLPSTLRDDMADRPNWYRRQQQIFAATSEDEWRTALACYYGRISELDAQFGLLIDYLESSGQLENTVVIVTADHGKYVGAHGMEGHNFGAFEEIYNIPLVAAGPGITQGVNSAARVGLHAVGPTLLEWAGADPLPNIDATSFADLCGDPTLADRYTTGYAENHGNRFVMSQRIVWDGPWKLAFNGFDFDELYNLAEDPHETQNRAADPQCADVLRSLTTELWRRIRASDDQALYNSHYYTMRTAAVGPNSAAKSGEER